MAEEGHKVVLNVYDLSQGLARQLSSTFLGKVIEGIWHTGIVVYDTEYYFGGGIQHSPVGRTPYGTPLKIVQLGTTHLPEEVFEDYLQEISPRYTADTYNLLHHNCNNFSNELAYFLVGCNIPEFILRLPEQVIDSPMGSLILPMIQQFETTLRFGGVPQVPHLGSSSLSAHVTEHQGTPNVISNPSHKVTAQEVGARTEKEKPPVTSTRDSSLVAPANDSGEPYSSDDSVKLDAKEYDPCGSAPPKSEPCQTAQNASSDDPLGDARAQVQKEIAQEFAILMATGSLRASEAAAIAARRVMEKYGKLKVAVRQS